MNFHFGNNTQAGKSYYFQVEVGPNPETFESYMKRIFAAIGLRSGYSIKAFDKFMGQSYFLYMVNNAKNNAAVADAVKNSKGKIINITVHIYPAIVEKLKRFGVNLSVSNKGMTYSRILRKDNSGLSKMVKSSFFNSIFEFFKDFEGCSPIDISLGNQDIENVTAIAQTIAEEKEWISRTKNTVKTEPYLMQYEFSKKLVWFVYFTHLFDQEKKEEFENEITAMRFAVVRIEDETGEILFADFIKPQIT